LLLNFFHEAAREPAISHATSELRVAGRTISGFMGRLGAVEYTGVGWLHQAVHYHTLAITGGSRLLFETRHNLRFISDPVDHVYFIGAGLSANGVSIARYVSHENLWRGTQRPLWCRTFRVIAADATAARLPESYTRMNPWEAGAISLGDWQIPDPDRDSGPESRRQVGVADRVS
jgi:hypothetical protein